MKNLKLLICLLLMVFTVGCKKNEIDKEPSFEEMKAIMLTSPELKQAFKLENELNITRQTAIHKNLINKRNSLKTESLSNINTNSFKSEADFKQFFDKYYDNKGGDILIKIKSQLESLKQFGEKNPAFNKLSEKQRKELLNFSFSDFKKKLDLSKNMLLIRNTELEIKVNENCMDTFNIDFLACSLYYIGATTTNWAIVASTGGSAALGGLIAQLGIEAALWICQDTAADHYLNCFNNF